MGDEAENLKVWSSIINLVSLDKSFCHTTARAHAVRGYRGRKMTIKPT